MVAIPVLKLRSRVRAKPGFQQGAFEAAILLVLRSKELGLPIAGWVEQARSTQPAGLPWQEYLDIADAVPVDQLSADRDEVLRDNIARRRPRAIIDEWRSHLLTGPGSALFRAYLDVSISCATLAFDERKVVASSTLNDFAGIPLLRYRVGACAQPELLESVLDLDADFIESHLELGRFALQQERPQQVEALRHLHLLMARFPGSATASTTIGDLHRDREEWNEALGAYDAALVTVSSHRDALLGSMVSLSHLSRHEDAIVSATKLIELGSWFIADAHYWRAWNEYQLDRILEARADVDQAKALAANPSTLVLSGIIAWRERRLETAETEFASALSQDFGYCEAASYLGGVRAERRGWPESLEAFEHASRCFNLSILTRRKLVAELSATEADAASNASQIASHQRAIIDAERRKLEADQNVRSLCRQVRVKSC